MKKNEKKVKVDKVFGKNETPNFAKSAVSRRFIAKPAIYPASVKLNDAGGIDFTQLTLKDGNTLCLVECTVTVGSKQVRAQIACTDEIVFADLVKNAKDGTQSKIEVTRGSNGAIYSRFLSNEEIEILDYSEDTEEQDVESNSVDAEITATEETE